MKHSIKKIKVRAGQDANQMLVKKLLINFLKSSSLVTTEKKAKVLKMMIDRVVSKAKEKTEANKNMLLRYFPNKKHISVLFDQVAPVFADRTSGFVTLTRLNQRANDGASMVQVSWISPVVIDWDANPAKKETQPAEKKK